MTKQSLVSLFKLAIRQVAKSLFLKLNKATNSFYGQLLPSCCVSFNTHLSCDLKDSLFNTVYIPELLLLVTLKRLNIPSMLLHDLHSSAVKIPKSSANLQLLENRIPHQTFLAVADNNSALDMPYFTEMALCRLCSGTTSKISNICASWWLLALIVAVLSKVLTLSTFVHHDRNALFTATSLCECNLILISLQWRDFGCNKTFDSARFTKWSTALFTTPSIYTICKLF